VIQYIIYYFAHAVPSLSYVTLHIQPYKW